MKCFHRALPLVLTLVAACCSNAQAAPSSAEAIGGCTTESCLLEHIPRGEKPTISMDACKVLDGKLEGDDDLGMVCRLRIARALATFREQAPCITDEEMNPDWSISIEEPLRLREINERVAASHFSSHGITSERTDTTFNNSTIHSSYIFNTFFYDPNRSPRTYVSSATYFCRSGTPEHYVPFFYVLKINDGPAAEKGQGSSAVLRILAMEYVETLPVGAEHVLHQLGGLAIREMTGYAVADVNGDGHEDVVVVDKRWSDPKYPLRVCLFESKAEACRMIEVDSGLASDKFRAEPRVRVAGGQITVRLLEGDTFLADQIFVVQGDKVVPAPPAGNGR